MNKPAQVFVGLGSNLENPQQQLTTALDELSRLPDLARKKAAETGLPAEAEKTLHQQLEQRIQTSQPLRLIFKDEKKSE